MKKKQNKSEIKENYFLPKVAGQCPYHDVSSMYMRHFVQDDIYQLKDVIQDIMTTSSLVAKRCIIDPSAQLNSMVSSWTTNGKATTAGSLLVFEDNVGEDGLSSQSTYSINIDDPYYKASISPNPKVMNDLKPSKEQLEKVYGGIMKEVNDLRLQIDSKKPFLALIFKAKSSILILPKFKPKMCFWPLDDID
jgi:hypothetical protein